MRVYCQGKKGCKSKVKPGNRCDSCTMRQYAGVFGSRGNIPVLKRGSLDHSLREFRDLCHGID